MYCSGIGACVKIIRAISLRGVSLTELYVKKEYNSPLEKRRMINYGTIHMQKQLTTFNESIVRQNIVFKQCIQYDLLIHQPTGLSMRLSPQSTVHHKRYMLDKLNERIRDTGTWTLTPTKE